MPYIIHFDSSNLQSSSQTASILLAVSVTISSPILALNLLLRHPIPLPSPSSLFDAPRDLHPVARPSYASPSLSDQVNAADNLKRLRLLSALGPAPKLSLFPSNDTDMKTPQTPPQPSVHADTFTEDDRADAGGGDVPVLAPPKRAARHQQQRHRHSDSFHHHHHPTQRSYDRARRQTKSLSVSFPTCDDPLF